MDDNCFFEDSDCIWIPCSINNTYNTNSLWYPGKLISKEGENAIVINEITKMEHTIPFTSIL